jgi:hypothetical protein
MRYQPELIVSMVAAVILGLPATARQAPQNHKPDLQKVYADESHCLTSPEIRSDKDSSISCFCRDAIADARYIYFNYFSASTPHPDPNMSGIFLALQSHAVEMCSRVTAGPLDMKFIDKIDAATMQEGWKWDGPEVVRTYPPDDVIRQIKPDSRGWISVQYTVVLLQRDSQGRVTATESFSAVDEGPARYMLSNPPSKERPVPKAQAKD